MSARIEEIDSELLDLYLSHVPGSLGKMREAYEDADKDKLKFYAHELIPAVALLDDHLSKELLVISDERKRIKFPDKSTVLLIEQIDYVIKKLRP